MKRSLDLYRDLLFAVEDHADPRKGAIQIMKKGDDPLRFPGADTSDLPESLRETDPPVLLRHLELMTQAELLETNALSPDAERTTDGRLFMAVIYGLTHKGHDFLENIREDTVWNQTKEEARSLALDVVRATAEGIVKGATGIE